MAEGLGRLTHIRQPSHSLAMYVGRAERLAYVCILAVVAKEGLHSTSSGSKKPWKF